MLLNPPPADPIEEAEQEPRWSEDTRKVAGRTAIALFAVLLCYHTSLWTLMRGLTVDTPLAYLGLVPIIAAVLGYALARPSINEPNIHDRHIDRIVGVPLVIAAFASLVLLPARLSTMYWLYRIDLLTMPLFVAGVVALAFGVRMLWRTKAAVLFLFLAWPIPIRGLVTLGLEPLTGLTAGAVRMVVGVIPVATVMAGDGITFQVAHGGAQGTFLVQVASACSGANGLLGFLLVASAFTLVARGTKSAKFSWLAAGTALVWVFNVIRIVAILAVGKFFGETASIDILHPVAGLFTFNIAVLIMVLQAHRFGLSLPVFSGPSRTRAVLAAVPTAGRAMLGIVVIALFGSVFNHNLTAYDPISSSVGNPRVGKFSQVSLRPTGFRGERVGTFENGKRFFGEDSSWVRYQYAALGTSQLGSDVPVLADVINTGKLQAFSDFGIEACYRFHGYSTEGVKRVDLGNGVVGTVLNWADPDGLAWTTVYWLWAVREGSGLRYERVVLLLNDSNSARVASPPLEDSIARQVGIRADEAVRGAETGDVTARQGELRTFLVQFARRVIQSSADRSAQMPEPVEFGG
ncbi:MAG: exosortase/archaeosortase family protein [Actinobacteria bacterium]|nr:exosortase/archaeosortase family protein [Actinomycetota bacterium]